MGLVDILKNRAMKKDDKLFEEKKDKIYADWTNLISDYNSLITDRDCVNQGTMEWNKMYQNIEGVAYNIGLSKTTFSQDPKQSHLYEFLIIKPQPDGQVDSVYYRMTQSGDLHHDRGLGTLSIEYIANVEGRQIPCTVNIGTSTQELASMQGVSNTGDLQIKITNIVSESSMVSAEKCVPDMNDINNIVVNFSRLNSRYSYHVESTADFMPGER